MRLESTFEKDLPISSLLFYKLYNGCGLKGWLLLRHKNGVPV
jgi:hypothetical protein